MDGTLIEARASQKNFQHPQDGESFHGYKRSNQTHASRTDPDAKLYRKISGSEARLSYLGHTLVENRNGLIVGTYLTQADGYAERDAALLMAHQKRRKSKKPLTLAADKAYDTQDFVGASRDLKITPHVAQNEISQAKRYWAEKSFGWMKSVGLLRKVKLRGREKLWWLFTFTAAAFNIWRIPRLQAAPLLKPASRGSIRPRMHRSKPPFPPFRS